MTPLYNRKGAIVERVRNDKTRREGVVRLDKSSMTFFARVPDNAAAHDRPAMMESKDGSEVARWLREQLAKSTASELLTWLPVVEVSVSEPGYYYGRDRSATRAGFEVTLARFYLALTADKSEWVRLSWEEADAESVAALRPEDRVASSKKFRAGPGNAKATETRTAYGDKIMRALPFFDNGTNYLPHSVELWAGLVQIVETVNAAEAHIRHLVGTKAGLAQLLDDGVKRLAAGPVPTTSGEDDE